MATIHDCSDPAELLTGMRLARTAIARGELVVMPTDTVYGVAADAFDADAVQRLLDAKGRGRQSPPPVLIPNLATLDALAAEVPAEVRALVDAFWPGGLTVIVPARESLQWDLGDTAGTVALRMPSNPVALALLAETGPLAVSSANLTGKPAATTVDEARDMLADTVAVYLDGGVGGTEGSTIIDATRIATDGVRIVRHGAIPDAAITEILDGLGIGGDAS
jgi:L-threonylcarbamoyladenylate synthase